MLPYFDQAIQHLNSGYPRLWTSWIDMTREIDEYNQNQAGVVESLMTGVVISRMRALFTQPPLNVVTTFQNEFYVENICDEIHNFWVRRFVEYGEPQLVIRARDPNERMMQLNGRDVYWNNNANELRAANQFLVDFAQQGYQIDIPEVANLYDQSREARERYIWLAQELADFQISRLEPIINTLAEEREFQGRCDRCPTVMTLLRKLV